MKYNCLDRNGELTAIVDADDEAEALRKGRTLNSETVSVGERQEREHETREPHESR